jgi:hypothetical protein
MRRFALILPIAALGLSGCGGGGLQPITITPNEERLAIGTAAGALGGLAIGSLTAQAGVGALIGAGVGVAAGALYNHHLEQQRQEYQAGYNAARAGRPPAPPRS